MKPAADFNREARRTDGLQAWCRACKAEHQADRLAKRGRTDEERAKRRAHRLVHEAVARGEIKKPEACQSCGNAGRIEAHHHNYSKPLDVVWLCSSCHHDEHHPEQPCAAGCGRPARRGRRSCSPECAVWLQTPPRSRRPIAEVRP